jgi:hypothetical protein
MSYNKIQVSSNAPIIYKLNGEIDIRRMIPDYAKLMDAMERGENWYDLIYPNNQNTYINEGLSGKKRKNPFVKSGPFNKNKKPRYE